MKLEIIVKIAMMAAVMCVCGPLTINLPISPVPITFTNLVIYFALYVLGMKYGTISYLIYMAIGFIGVPVFSNFSGGPIKLLGPTGGYIIGLVFMSIIAGYFIEKYDNKLFQAIGMILGNIVLYVFGSAWLAFQMEITFIEAVIIGVLPFIISDIVKIIIAVFVGNRIKVLMRNIEFRKNV